MPRPFWSGHIQISLVSFGVKLFPATEAKSEIRFHQISRKTGERISFPDEPLLSREPYQGRHWARLVESVEPGYVCYGRLYFEQPNSERYGWDLGIFQPVAATGVFCVDSLLLPVKLATLPLRCHECSAGKCLPGDPVPLRLARRDREPWPFGLPAPSLTLFDVDFEELSP